MSKDYFISLIYLSYFYIFLNPVTFHDLVYCQSFRWINDQHLSNKHLGLRWYILPNLLFEIISPTFNRCKYFFIIFPHKRRCSTQEHIQYDSKRPNIAFLIIFLVNDLRRNIIRLKYKMVITVPTLLRWIIS